MNLKMIQGQQVGVRVTEIPLSYVGKTGTLTLDQMLSNSNVVAVNDLI